MSVLPLELVGDFCAVEETALVTEVARIAGVGMLESSVCLVGARLFGPFARPLVLCSSGSVEVGGVSPATTFDAGPPLVPGGPRDRTPNNAGLNRSASLLEAPAFAMPGSANGEGFDSALFDFKEG